MKKQRKRLFSIQEIADELGVHKYTIYNWEKAGKMPKAKRDPMNNYRVYSEEDLRKIKKLSGRE